MSHPDDPDPFERRELELELELENFSCVAQDFSVCLHSKSAVCNGAKSSRTQITEN